ncbi:TPA: non-canonical purine NTP pyrophosphatase, RdgB/HAM1 family [Candidatus Magasanikbacteria bacterium]|nr:MAG: non-canonical purine NTP pyrophosphatase, RdgB/HAM1 family [Candidatus Magasanikbacteria bacterium RIFOXYD12_FULL_33_17]HAO52081.1 non-canonical purine NTP pyrophosphatase, RdgB/HAM1 family [Candidatus Magasanikbacteria bacterium]
MPEEKRKILIATTNEGKFREMKKFLADLPFDFLSLAELPEKIAEPEETESTIEANAVLKAKYYAEKTGLMSIADDGGIFVEALDGWPGVISARVGADADERINILLEKLKDVPIEKRQAEFKSCLVCYDPQQKSFFSNTGIREGLVLEKRVDTETAWGYDPIFYLKDLGKTYAELTPNEKNATSHRGKALIKIKYYLQNQYGVKHIVVPLAIIIEKGKILMSKRNDPHRLEFHNKWEFPGGSMELGETFETNVTRETLEEVGYVVEVVRQLSKIYVEAQIDSVVKYQVYLVPMLCKVISNTNEISDAETLGVEWFDLEKAGDENMIGANNKLYQEILPELIEYTKLMSS